MKSCPPRKKNGEKVSICRSETKQTNMEGVCVREGELAFNDPFRSCAVVVTWNLGGERVCAYVWLVFDHCTLLSMCVCIGYSKVRVYAVQPRCEASLANVFGIRLSHRANRPFNSTSCAAVHKLQDIPPPARSMTCSVQIRAL